MHSNCLYERASTCWLSVLARHEEGFCESYRYINNSTYIWTICKENPSEYLTIFICLQSRYVFSKKPLVLRNGRLQSTMDAKNSSDFVIRLNKYLFTCDGNSFQNNQNMVLGTLSYVIAAWYAMHDVWCTMQAEDTMHGLWTIHDRW